jgi:hypothetical protein
VHDSELFLGLVTVAEDFVAVDDSPVILEPVCLCLEEAISFVEEVLLLILDEAIKNFRPCIALCIILVELVEFLRVVHPRLEYLVVSGHCFWLNVLILLEGGRVRLDDVHVVLFEVRSNALTITTAFMFS